jgi:organic radical activating enzyme
MKPFEVSEIFLSLEGEALYNSHPTMYIRFSRCNFTCFNFNNPTHEKTPDGYAPLEFVPADFNTLLALPLISKGCDSQYAVNPSFSHMWEKLTVDEIADRIKSLLPHNSWTHPDTGLPVILSLTGGEPTLFLKRFDEILNHPFISQCKHILVETNCAVPLTDKGCGVISKWLQDDSTRKWTWSNSPKLMASGEPWDKAIVPKIAVKQLTVIGNNDSQVDQYFKFVCDPIPEQFDEVRKAMIEYHNAGVPKTPNIWIMPTACSYEQQNAIAQDVAKMCVDAGFLFCYRIQNALWGNQIGT